VGKRLLRGGWVSVGGANQEVTIGGLIFDAMHTQMGGPIGKVFADYGRRPLGFSRAFRPLGVHPGDRFSKGSQKVKMGHQEIAGVLWKSVVLCDAFGVDLQRTSREQGC